MSYESNIRNDCLVKECVGFANTLTLQVNIAFKSKQHDIIGVDFSISLRGICGISSPSNAHRLFHTLSSI